MLVRCGTEMKLAAINLIRAPAPMWVHLHDPCSKGLVLYLRSGDMFSNMKNLRGERHYAFAPCSYLNKGKRGPSWC